MTPCAVAKQKLFADLNRLHILHHVDKEPFYGLWLIEELARHDHRPGPGTP
jgi:hypothetical protein